MGGQFGSLHLPLEVRWHFWSRAPLYAGPVSARDMDWAIAMPSHAGDCASVTPDCTVDYSVGDGNCDAINLVSEKCAYDAGKRPALLLWLHIYPVLLPLLLCGAQCVVRTLGVPCAYTAVAHRRLQRRVRGDGFVTHGAYPTGVESSFVRSVVGVRLRGTVRSPWREYLYLRRWQLRLSQHERGVLQRCRYTL